MTDIGRIAECEVCDEVACEIGDLLVRGDRVSFVSMEQVRRLGAKRRIVNDRVEWTPRMPPADVTLPSDYVIVHDTSGKLFSPCDLYVVRWNRRPIIDSEDGSNRSAQIMRSATQYYGPGVPIHVGSVEHVEGPWKRIPGKIALIRYRRVGVEKDTYEHDFNPPIDLYQCKTPLAWRMPLPDGCVVTKHGFERP